MNEVAKAVGLHCSSVSLALRDHPSIPPATRARVRRAAERVGYRVNPLVSALMSYRRSSRNQLSHTTIAYVTSSQPADAWKESRTMNAQYLGAVEQARLQGYQVEEHPFYAPGLTPARFNEVLWSRGIVGLVIAPLLNGKDTLPIEWGRFAAVSVAFSLRTPPIPRVGSDHGPSVRLAVCECRARGYKRIGLAIQHDVLERVEGQWLAGYLYEHSYPVALRHPAPLIVDAWHPAEFLAWVRRERPDVIVAGGNADMLIAWLRKARFKVPEQIGVVSLDLHSRDGSIAGIDQSSEEIGASVIDYLIARLHRNERGAPARPVRLHVMGEWVDGATIQNV